jgi:hypothetical protein
MTLIEKNKLDEKNDCVRALFVAYIDKQENLGGLNPKVRTFYYLLLELGSSYAVLPHKNVTELFVSFLKYIYRQEKGLEQVYPQIPLENEEGYQEREAAFLELEKELVAHLPLFYATLARGLSAIGEN